jgi:TatD DNase family protein
MFDTHAHLNHSDFADDVPETVARAAAAGVQAMVIVGYDVASSRDAVMLAQTYPALYATVGLHPHSAAEFSADLLQDLRRCALQPRVVALGETGLDFYRNLSPPDRQREAFRALTGLAGELGLPLVVHNREAHEEVLEILAQELPPEAAVIMHCFSGDGDFAEECRRRDYYLGFTGSVTYPKSEALREVARVYPGRRALLETDSPWLAPQTRRGRRNEPAYLPEIAATIAEVRGEPLVRLEQQTTENARRVFRLNGESA